MSYDLHFIKKQDLTIQQSIDFLAKPSTSRSHQFSGAETEKMISEITEMNQHTAIEKAKKETTIDFENFKISFHKNQLIISIPFSEDNLTQKVSAQVNCIIDIFLESGCIGFDTQIKKFIDDDYSFKTVFSQCLNIVTASKKSDVKGPDFPSEEAAEKFYFKDRDKTLALVDSIKEAYPKKKLDFSSESLKHLEWIFYDGLENDAFGKTLPAKKDFYKLLSIYKAKVYVKNKAYKWKICVNFYQKTYQLAIQDKKGMHTMFIEPRNNFEEFPDDKNQALLKEYMREV